ncbi:hypothetical protein L204_105204 [Cryptococcus depauperatus]
MRSQAETLAKFPTITAYLRPDGDDKSEQIRQEFDLVIDARVKGATGGFTEIDKRLRCGSRAWKIAHAYDYSWSKKLPRSRRESKRGM